MIWLDNARISATIAVVILHTSAYVVLNGSVGSEYWWIGNFYDSFSRWCVPVFVMISGALLLDPDKAEDLKTFYYKRLSKIAVPILFWTAFFLLLAVLWSELKGKPISLHDFLERIISGKPYYHMWYLYMIMMLYLFTPFFRKIIINSKRREIFTFVILGFLLAGLNEIGTKYFGDSSPFFINRFIPYVPYYFLGYLIATGEYKFSKTILWSVFFISSCLTALGCYIVAIHKSLNAGLYFYGYLSITVIPMSVSVMYLLKSWTKPIKSIQFTKRLALLTLGVYLIHPIIMELFQYKGVGPLKFYPAVSIPVIAVIAFCSALSGAWVIYKVPYLKRII